MLDIDVFQIEVLKPDRVGRAVQRIIDFFAAQQRPHDPDIFGEGFDAHRRLTHGAHRRVAGAKADKGAARRQPVDRGDRVRRHRRQPQAADRQPGAEFDRARLLRRQGQNRPGVGTDQMAVGGPAIVVAKILGMGDETDLVDFRPGDAKFHARSLYSWRWPDWGYQLPIFAIDAQGSCSGSLSPVCSNSIEMLSGERIKAM